MSQRHGADHTPCTDCPLGRLEALRPLSAQETAFMQEFKRGEMSVSKRTQVLVEGSISPHIYTVLRGILMRFKAHCKSRWATVSKLLPTPPFAYSPASAFLSYFQSSPLWVST